MLSDGLDKGNVWSGNVYVNPPFGVRMVNGRKKSMQGLFLQRAIQEYSLSAGPQHASPDTALATVASGDAPGMMRRGQVMEIILLLKAAPGSNEHAT